MSRRTKLESKRFNRRFRRLFIILLLVSFPMPPAWRAVALSYQVDIISTVFSVLIMTVVVMIFDPTETP